MRGYNFVKPVMFLIIVYLVRKMAYSISLMLGANADMAGDIGFICMITAAIIMYVKYTRNGRNTK